mgnify:CR=1 FL=1
MITTEGSLHIKRFLTGSVGTIAQSIALGVGTAAESAGSTALDFEVVRADIHLVSYDFTLNKLVFKATLPEDFIGTVYEAGLWSQSANTLAHDYGSRLLVSFEDYEGWNATLSPAATNAGRFGEDVLVHTPAASATVTAILSDQVLDLSGNSAADSFSFAYNVGNANTAGITIRFYTDDANYYGFNLGAQTAGYKVTKMTKGIAQVTGVPNWGNITQVRVITTSTAGGASNVSYDAIRIEDVDTVNPEYVLVARDLLATPYSKTESTPQDIEFTLGVTVT